MKIAIHNNKYDFSSKWVDYCRNAGINYKLVNCYSNSIVKDLEDCDALMWHFHHANYRDTLFAKQLIFSLEIAGKKVFPNFKTSWHFDDKVAQKYLLESHKIPMPRSYVFYEREEALRWSKSAKFPKIFKLRKGASSSNVMFINNEKNARKIIVKSFTKGFSQYNSINNIFERWRKYKMGKVSLPHVGKGFLRIIYPTEFSNYIPREKGYVYFQDFIPENKFDIRITYVCGRCFAVRRKVRNYDFRASGSGLIDYNLNEIPVNALRLAFDVAEKLQLTTAAFDIVMEADKPLLLELSYGFGHDGIPLELGYWDSSLRFNPGAFNPYGWMVQDIVNNLNGK